MCGRTKKSRTAFLSAGFPDFEKGMDGMGVSVELERAVQSQLPKKKQHEHEIGG